MKKIDKLLYEERKEFYERYPDHFIEFLTGMKLCWFEGHKLRVKCRVQRSFEKMMRKLIVRKNKKGVDIMNEKENMLVGFDICKLLENACDTVLTPPYTDGHDDEEQWREAYDKGIADTISLLKQLIEHALIDDTECCNYVIAHVPELAIMTEFTSLDEIVNR